MDSILKNQSEHEEHPIAPGDPAQVNNRSLWFQVAGSGVAWFTLGLVDLIITWRACVHEDLYGSPSSHPGAEVIFFVAWFALAALALTAGTLSYRTWRRLSGVSDLLKSEGRERKEFMSQAGFFVSLTLGVGIIWLFLPLLILQMCARTR